MPSEPTRCDCCGKPNAGIHTCTPQARTLLDYTDALRATVTALAGERDRLRDAVTAYLTAKDRYEDNGADSLCRRWADADKALRAALAPHPPGETLPCAECGHDDAPMGAPYTRSCSHRYGGSGRRCSCRNHALTTRLATPSPAAQPEEGPTNG